MSTPSHPDLPSQLIRLMEQKGDWVADAEDLLQETGNRWSVLVALTRTHHLYDNEGGVDRLIAAARPLWGVGEGEVVRLVLEETFLMFHVDHAAGSSWAQKAREVADILFERHGLAKREDLWPAPQGVGFMAFLTTHCTEEYGFYSSGDDDWARYWTGWILGRFEHWGGAVDQPGLLLQVARHQDIDDNPGFLLSLLDAGVTGWEAVLVDEEVQDQVKDLVRNHPAARRADLMDVAKPGMNIATQTKPKRGI